MKKVLVLFLAMVLLVSVLPLSALAEAAAEPVHVIMLDPYYGDASGEKGYQMVHDYILEQTGVDVTSYRFGSNEKTEKQDMLLQSTDIKVNTWDGKWTKYVGYGMIQPITQYVDMIPNVIKKWEPYQAMGSVTAPDGTVWGVPRISSRSFYQTFVRQDYLDALNLEAPTNMDELEKVLYALKEADPYGNGETITLIARSGNLNTQEYHFLAGYTQYGRSNWPDEDGSIKPYYLQPGYYDFLAKMIQWRNDGIFHPENDVWTLAEVRNYLAAGRCAASAAYTTDLSNQTTTMKQNVPGSSWYYCETGLVGPNGNKAETLVAGDDECCCFNAKNTDEEMRACLTVIEWGYSDWHNNKILNSGIEGLHWVYDESKPNAREDHVTIDISGSIEDTSMLYKGDFWYTIGMGNEGDCIIYDADGTQNYHNVMLRHQKDFDATTIPYDLGVIYNNTELYDNVMSANDIETMVSEEIYKFYKGERELTPENWQAFIDELYDAGMQEYIDEITRQYKAWFGIA